jgi:hypothetical protein
MTVIIIIIIIIIITLRHLLRPEIMYLLHSF